MFVGNLPFEATELDLRDLFSEFGQVNEVAIVMDRETQRPRGFAFVTMDTTEGMEAAIRGNDGKNWNGRPMAVNEARPREERPAFSGNRGGSNDRNDRKSRRW